MRQRAAFGLHQRLPRAPFLDQGTQKPQQGIEVKRDQADGHHRSAGNGQFGHDSLQGAFAFDVAQLLANGAAKSGDSKSIRKPYINHPTLPTLPMPDFTEIDREDFRNLLAEIGQTHIPFGKFGIKAYPKFLKV